MAKKAYIGVNGVARKIKKGYIGIDGVARRIKKAYIGVGGVARPCWSGGELTYYGSDTLPSEVGRYNLAGVGTDSHAFFAGGLALNADGESTVLVNSIDVFTRSLTKTSSVVKLPEPRQGLAAARAGKSSTRVVFAGGLYGSTNAYTSSAAYSIDSSTLTLSTITEMSVACHQHAGTSVGNYAVFAGGFGLSHLATVNAYTSSLTRSNPPDLSVARYRLAAASVSNYALFAGGVASSSAGSSATEVVDIYDSSLATVLSTQLSVARYDIAATSVGNYVLFVGGLYSGGVGTVDVFDASLTRSALSCYARYKAAATTVEDYAIIGGGFETFSNNNVTKVVEAFDASLTRTVEITGLSQARQILVAASVGPYAIFAGGVAGSLYCANVDIYAVL